MRHVLEKYKGGLLNTAWNECISDFMKFWLNNNGIARNREFAA